MRCNPKSQTQRRAQKDQNVDDGFRPITQNNADAGWIPMESSEGKSHSRCLKHIARRRKEQTRTIAYIPHTSIELHSPMLT